MADTSAQLNQPDRRPLLAFQRQIIGSIPTGQVRGFGGPSQPQRPGHRRQGERLTPQFRELREALLADTTSLSETTGAPDPSYIIVFEVVGSIERFMKAATRIEGLNFIADYLTDKVDPDDDFHFEDEDGNVSDQKVPQVLYLVMANLRAIEQLISLFERWKQERDMKFGYGLTPLRDLFLLLHTVRRWNPQDRIRETGLIEAWKENIEVIGTQGFTKVEVELVWQNDYSAREIAQARVEQMLGSGRILSTFVLEQIQYHAVLAEIVASDVQKLLDGRPEEVDVLCVDEVLFVADATPMSLSIETGNKGTAPIVDDLLPSGKPKVAMIDGVPLLRHNVLVDRLEFDDPGDLHSAYSPNQCRHGTEMASLIIHGDLSDPGPAISTPLYVYPVLLPHPINPKIETLPADKLFVDVVHSAFKRIFDEPQSVAPSVRVVNVSLGDPARPFIKYPSPLARLLDYFAHRYNVLIIVSAGNHSQIVPKVPASVLDNPNKMTNAVEESLREQGRHRRLLSPAESINSLTVGATHDDHSSIQSTSSTVLDPLPHGNVATYSASGPGFQRAPKPEIYAPGGRMLMLRPPSGAKGIVGLPAARTGISGPGTLTAAPMLSGEVSGFMHTYGTSNATALVSRSAHQVLDKLGAESPQASHDTPSFPSEEYYPVLTKALLVNAALWPMSIQSNNRSSNSEHLGFGVLDKSRLIVSTRNRVMLIGAGSINADERHSFRFPLPFSLSGMAEWRRLVLTLAWFSPVLARTQRYRMAHLKVDPPLSTLQLTRAQVVNFMNGKGTVQHEVLEGKQATAFKDTDELLIDVDCRIRVGKLDEPVRFGLVATLEVGSHLNIDVYQEVRDKLRIPVRIPARAR